MSVQRNQSSQNTESAQQREIDNRLRNEKLREPATPEQVDRFRTLMEKKETAGQAPRDPASAAEAQTAEAQMADARHATQAADEQASAQAANDAGAAREMLSGDVEDRASRRGDDLGLSAGSQPPADASAAWQAQMALRDGSMPPPAVPTPVNTQAFAELIQRHVQQLAASDGALRDGDGQVLLRMADATLPGTDLLLSRSGDGWLLRADVRSRDSFDAIRQAAPELSRRFADSNLGALSIEPHFHG